ncbi:MAG: radical SAM protein [Candidatus Bathyarchaeia archaeon]
MVQIDFKKIIPRGFKLPLFHLRVRNEIHGTLRLHLRLEKDGSGVLIINASRVIFLNKTAAEYVALFLKGFDEDKVVRKMVSHYNIDEETVRKDYREVLYVINTFVNTPDVCPISYLGVEKMEPFQRELSAPYRMDLAITYRCNNRCMHCYIGGPKETRELTTNQWFKIMNKIFDLGIPHVVFTGGEPTLRDDLPDLIAYAEKLGLVCGLVTNGRKLKDKIYLQYLVDAGLDHIQITLESHNQEIHDKITGVVGSWEETVQGLKNAIESPIYTLTNTTLNKHNISNIIETIDFLSSLGLKQFACNGLIYSGKATEPETFREFAIEESVLESLLANIKGHAKELNMEFTWYTPTEYCILNPLKLDLGIKTCSACRISMCIEPDGTVIPCQSYFTPLGNILKDDWSKIWHHPLCVEIRSRKYVPEKCYGCSLLNICGGGCPLKIKYETYICGSIP